MKDTNPELLALLRRLGYSSLADYQKHPLDNLDTLHALANVVGVPEESGIPDANGRRVWKFRPSGLIDSELVDDDGDHE